MDRCHYNLKEMCLMNEFIQPSPTGVWQTLTESLVG
jgi:hypothetical protein